MQVVGDVVDGQNSFIGEQQSDDAIPSAFNMTAVVQKIDPLSEPPGNVLECGLASDWAGKQ
jgi:hypothetical protein